MSITAPIFAALMAAGSFIRIPLAPAAITLQTLFLFMLSLMLPAKEAVKSVLLYLFIGAIGFPVFSTGGGLAGLIGPTGGFLIAMIPASLIGSLIVSVRRDSILMKIVALAAMNIILYAIGLAWMMARLNMNLQSAFIAGCLPYIPGDAVKALVAIAVSSSLKGEIDSLLSKKE